MKRRVSSAWVPALLISTTVFALVASPAPVSAQCCGGYRVTYYRVQPAYYYVRPAPTAPRWAAGIHLTGVSTDQMLGDDGVLMGGLGGHLRYRGYRFGVELAIDGIGGSFVNNQIRRFSVPMQASALLYLIPEGPVNLYLLGGPRVVGTFITWDYPGFQDRQEFVEFGMHGGVGMDINLGPYVALTGDLRFFGVIRGNDDPAGAYYARLSDDQMGVVPKDTAGVQLNLGVSFRF